MPVEGQEDDDFAYQDEHIEMESDNEEYEPLDEGEFDSSSALIRAEPKPAAVPSSVAPQPDAKPAPHEGPPELQSRRASTQNIPKSPKIPARGSRLANAAGPQASKVKRATRQPAKPPTAAPAQRKAKAPTTSRATKRAQAVRKNAAAKPAKKTLGKKVAPPKKSSPAKKKGAPKARKKLVRSRPAPRKKRRA